MYVYRLTDSMHYLDKSLIYFILGVDNAMLPSNSTYYPIVQNPSKSYS